MLRDLVTRSRSYRRFRQGREVTTEEMADLIGLARLTPSAGNKQPLKYILSNSPERNGLIFPCITWAAYLKDWGGPAEGERPAAYVIILGDNEISETIPWDHGIAAQTIALGAAEKGLGTCIIASVDREKLRAALAIPQRYQIMLVVAIGQAAEEVVLEEIRGGDFKYWRDENSVHHVPKRPLSELILERW